MGASVVTGEIGRSQIDNELSDARSDVKDPLPFAAAPAMHRLEPPHQHTSRLVMCIFLQGVA